MTSAPVTVRSGSRALSISGHGFAALLAILSLLSCGADDPAGSPADENAPADIVLLGGTIRAAFEAQPAGTALAIRNGRVLLIGEDADVATLAGPATLTIDLDGRLVVPGFADDHTHFMSGGFQLASVELRDADSPAEFARRIAAFAATRPAGEWILGGDWDHELWPEAPLPRREWVDSLTPDHPVMVSRLDGHMALANSVALRAAGVSRGTPDPPGGTIVRSPDSGEPTGVLKDEAMGLVFRVVPEPAEAARDSAFLRAQEHALARGVTMIHDMGDWSDLATYRRARDRGVLAIRVYSFVPLSSWERLRDFVRDNGRGDDLLRWGGLKGFVDGSLGSTTAWFYAPYDDEPATAGLLVRDTAAIAAAIRGADAAGLHVAVHAIGDRANDWLLGAFRAAAEANGPRDRRFRVEHAQHLTPAAIGAFAEQGVLPSMQPYHAVDDGRWAEKRIGPERIRTTYAFRDLLDAGAGLMFGSDWTVAPIDPLLGIDAAVNRRTIDGANPAGWVPEQRIAVREALHAYTAGNAYGAFMEDRLGTLQPGMLADLVVLSADIVAEPGMLSTASVDVTVVGGRIAYERVARPPS